MAKEYSSRRNMNKDMEIKHQRHTQRIVIIRLSVMNGGHDWKDGVHANNHKCRVRGKEQDAVESAVLTDQQGIHSSLDGTAAHSISFLLADASSLIQIFLYLFWGNLPFPSS